MGFSSGGSVAKNLPAMQKTQERRVQSQVRKIPWRRPWPPTPAFLSRESHWQRRLVDYSPWGHKESDMFGWSNQTQQRDRSHSTKAKVFSSFSRATDNILSHVLWVALQIRKLPPGRRSYQTVAITQSALSYTLPRAGLQMETDQPGNWRLTALKQSRWHDQTTAGSISRRLHVIPIPSPVPCTPETPLLKFLTPDWW